MHKSVRLSSVILFSILLFWFISACQVKQTLNEEQSSSVTLITVTETPLPANVKEEKPTNTATPKQQIAETVTLPLIEVTENWNYPESHYISPIYGHEQTYELGCEASAAVDWAGFFGVSIYEYTFQTALPLSDNPDFGFVGEVTTDAWGQIPPYAYGVHAGPVADLLQNYNLPAKAVVGYSIDQVKQKLSENKPIIVWVIGNMEYSNPVSYKDSQGRISIVAPYEHVVILAGYNESHLRYMNNGRFYEIPTEIFENSWSVLGNMAVIYE